MKVYNFESAFFCFFQQFFKKMFISSFSDYFCLFGQFFYVFIVFSYKVIFDIIKIKINSHLCCHIVYRHPRHRCRVNKDISTLKIELSVKRQNDQEQREQFTFYFSEKSLRKSIKSLILESEDLYFSENFIVFFFF
jgi:hypothetical protein